MTCQCKYVQDPVEVVEGEAYFRKENWPPGQALVWDVIAQKCPCGGWLVRRVDDVAGRLYEAEMVNDIV